jgi:D-aminopeptidase
VLRPATAIDRRRFLGLGLALAAGAAVPSSWPAGPEPRPRLRQLGIAIGSLAPGPDNAITDVAGVAVGHVTLEQDEVRTGVTAVLPRPDDWIRQPVFAADFALNGNGEMTGVGSVRRTGRLAAPILLTDTASVGAVYDAALGYLLEMDPGLVADALRPEPVVAETWAAFLSDPGAFPVRPEHVVQALRGARAGSVPEGSVGGGTGMRAYEFKAGIGTASRLVPCGQRTFTLGVLVQANHGRRPQLVVDGVPVGRQIPDLLPTRGAQSRSMLAVLATDAPLVPGQLRRLCKRVGLGMARTGAVSTHGSGDLFLAFSTAPAAANGRRQSLVVLDDGHLTPLYQGVVEAVEEAILNALTAARTVVGREGNAIHALPLDRLVEIMRHYGRLK